MAKKTIFEILAENIDIEYEIRQLEKLCNQDPFLENPFSLSYNLENFIESYCLRT